MKFSLRHPFVEDRVQRENTQDLLAGVNQIAQFVYAGTGVPTITPPGPALYFRYDFASGAAVYAFDGAWKSVA